MAAAIQFKLTGWKELRETFAELGKGVRNRVAKLAISAGARDIVKSTKQTAPVARPGQTTHGIPVQRGLLRKSLGMRSKVSRKSGVVYAVVGPRRKAFRVEIGSTKEGKPIFMNPTNYAHLMEHGHNIVRGGHIVGHFPGTKFAERGFETGAPTAMNSIERKFAEGIEREAIKARKQ